MWGTEHHSHGFARYYSDERWRYRLVQPTWNASVRFWSRMLGFRQSPEELV